MNTLNIYIYIYIYIYILKDEYPKLTLFKVRVLNCKSDKRSGVISEVFPLYIYIYISNQNIIKSAKRNLVYKKYTRETPI
jgi:hypothetical protein